MHQDCLTPFRELVQNHPAMRPLLYPYLAEQSLKNGLTAQAYQIVVTNLAAKTGLTLPRILVAATEGARALDPKITAYTTRTALEEAGDGEPKHVHTLLMMRALNYHGKVAFDLPTLNLKEIQELQIVLDNATRLLTFQISTEGLDAGLVRDIELSSDLDGLEAATLKLAKKQGFADQQTLRLDKSDLQCIQADATATLMELGVLPEVIAYGQEELYAQRTERVGYIQGVTFAGEAVADDMLLNLFKVMYKDLGKYKASCGQNDLPEDFERYVLPYFAAHGEYLANVQGREAVEDKQTEVIHAQREFAKLSRLDMESRAEALQGARDFADRNLRVWNGILAELLVRDPQLQSPVDRNDMMRILETLERQGAFGIGRQSVVEAVSEALGYF